MTAHRKVPHSVWAVTVLFALLLVGWSLLTPLHHAPDETVHADVVLQQARGGPYPAFDGRRTSQGLVTMALAYLPGFSGRKLTIDQAPPRDQRQSLEEWGGVESGAYANQIPQHPPLYYVLTGSALRLERSLTSGSDDTPLERDWQILRLLNAAMVLPLPLLAWAAACRLGVGEAAAITASVVPLAVPQLLHIGSSINNDNLLVLLGAVLAVLVAGVLQGDARLRVALAIGVVIGLALLTKGFAFALLPWVAGAYGWRAWRDREHWRISARALLVAAVTSVVIGGWWWARNLIRYGKLSPSILDPFEAAPPVGFEPDLLWFGRHFTTSVIHRFWGYVGYSEGPMTPALVTVASIVALAAIAMALVRPSEPGQGGGNAAVSRGQLVAFGAVFVIFVAELAAAAYGSYRSSGTTPFLQGRYLFPAMVPFAVVVATGVAAVFGRRAPTVVFGAAVLMQLDAVRVGLRGWWAEPDAAVSRSLEAMLAWSPWPSSALYALAVAIGLGAVATGWLLRPRPVVRVSDGAACT